LIREGTVKVRATVIVPFHRNIEQLRACLAGVRHSMPDAELIVAADGPVEPYRHVIDQHKARVVVVPNGPQGPAVARNRAAWTATGEVLMFVDTDVVPAPASLSGMVELLASTPSIDGVFGAYDPEPAAPNFMSQFKNLSHTYVHEVGRPDACTFWAGLGAIRADAFRAVGGFDERFRRPSVEDIDLGYRLVAAGYKLRLDPSFRGTHLKRWTFRGCVTTDLMARGIPWTQLIHRFKALSNDLNTSLWLRASVAVAYLILACALAAPFVPEVALAGIPLLAILVAMNFRYYRWLATQRRWFFATRTVPVHLVHHLCNGLSFIVGTALHAASRAGVILPGSLPIEPWPAAALPHPPDRVRAA